MSSFFILGFLLGMRHAVEADHLISMTTLNSQGNSSRDGLSEGIFWGMGHTAMLLIFGTAAIFFQLRISDDTAHYLEIGVGIMLVILGLNVLYRFKKNKVHFHQHQHHGSNNLHLHAHSHNRSNNTQETDIQHKHKHNKKIPIRAFMIGLVHGMAGSTALMLLVLETMQSTLMGLLYVAVFSTGSIVGMTLLSITITMPFRIIPKRFALMQNMLQIATFSSSVALGGYIIYQQVLAFG